MEHLRPARRLWLVWQMRPMVWARLVGLAGRRWRQVWVSLL